MLTIIGEFEGFCAEMYKVGGIGNWTIGYGHELCTKEEIKEYQAGITKEKVLASLVQDVQQAVNEIRRTIKVPFN